MKKFVIYTAIFGESGRFNFPEISIKGVDKICYTNLGVEDGCHQLLPVRKGRFKQNDFYEIRKRDPDQPTSVMQQRFMKIIPPDEIFDNYEYSAYVDCKRPIGIDFKCCEKLLIKNPTSDFLTRKHQRRDCVYDEAEKCIDSEKGVRSDIENQVNFYKKEHYPKHNGLYYTAFLFRRHTRQLRDFSKLWWEQLVKFSHRDQISLPYIAWKHDVEITKGRGRK